MRQCGSDDVEEATGIGTELLIELVGFNGAQMPHRHVGPGGVDDGVHPARPLGESLDHPANSRGIGDVQLLGTDPVQIMTLSNGCVCCTIHTDLTKALYLLLERLDSGEIAFDRLVIECTGLADPAPVAQTFFIDEELRERYILDGIITLVDAAHADTHLTQTIAQAQIGFADRLLVSKRDLVDDAAFDALSARLTRINRRAPIRIVEHGKIDLAELLDVRGFNLNADLGGGMTLRPLAPPGKSSDRITSLVLRSDKPLNLDRLSEFMNELLEDHGKQLLRYKGVLNIEDEPRKMVFQGVLKLYGFDWDADWAEGEPRESVIVFIADELPEEKIRAGFEKVCA